MKERDLLAIVAAIIWSQQRAEMSVPDGTPDEDVDMATIKEAVAFANDILVEVDEALKPPSTANSVRNSQVIDAEFTDDQPAHHSRR